MRHADGITLRNTGLVLQSPDSCWPLIGDDVRNLRMEDVTVQRLYEE